MNDYKLFLQNKRHSIVDSGFEPDYYPNIAFDFQKEIIRRATKKGRIAIFADTGLGKTLIQLSIAKNIVNRTNKKVLILTPAWSHLSKRNNQNNLYFVGRSINQASSHFSLSVNRLAIFVKYPPY